MPEYLSPGVYVEETSFRKKSIEAVSTSTAGIVGPTPHGPSEPTLVTSWSEYQQVFGAADEHEGTFLPYVVRGFFENGGHRLYVARIEPADGVETYTATDFIGTFDTVTQTGTGLSGLGNINEISLITIPDSVNEGVIVEAAEQDALIDAQVQHCERLLYRFAILNVPSGSSDARTIRPNIDSSRAAVYFPWVNVRAFDGSSTVLVPPSGHIAGIYARTDTRRGVHKAPANETVSGLASSALEFDINNREQVTFNELGINAIRLISGRGIRVWGARTLSSDPEWRYVNVRRLFIMLERSIQEGTRWSVFEPNDPKLWGQVQQTIENFLLSHWRDGALQGAKPDEAFFVRCDRSTMTQNDIDSGQLVCEIGVAPLKPAEFVIFRIGQKTADAD